MEKVVQWYLVEIFEKWNNAKKENVIYLSIDTIEIYVYTYKQI